MIELSEPEAVFAPAQSESPAKRAHRPAGTRLAAASRVAMLSLLCAGGAACLVTTPTEFDDTALPAHLSGARPFSFTSVPPAPDDVCEERSSWMAFQVNVSDANVNEPLVARLIVNGRRVRGANIRPTGTLEREPVSMCAALNQLSRPCNRVELAVSAAFDEEGEPYLTRNPGDFAKVEWWVLGPASGTPNAGREDCADLADAGAL